MNKLVKFLGIAAIVIVAVVAVSGFFKSDDGFIEDTTVTEKESVAFSDNVAAEATTLRIEEETEQKTTDRMSEASVSDKGTYTGLFPLQTVKLTASDPDNTRRLSTERIDHSFGVAKNSQPHNISVSSQQFFEENGYKAVTYDKITKEKVLYLTFDCGYENGNTEVILDSLKEKNVPAAFFCTLYHIEQEPELIARMINDGHIIGNHSDKHPDFSSIGRERMAREIETVENHLRTNFGYTSPYFRFPEGAYSECALELVGSLGYKSIFWSCAYADWDTENTKGADYAKETVLSRLHPGAIILLHSVSPDNAQAMGDIIDEARKMGYEFRSLDQLPD